MSREAEKKLERRLTGRIVIERLAGSQVGSTRGWTGIKAIWRVLTSRTWGMMVAKRIVTSVCHESKE
jgi:hypothetical protein